GTSFRTNDPPEIMECMPILTNWCMALLPPTNAHSSMDTWPATCTVLAIITLLLIIQSWAICTSAIKRQKSPILVTFSSMVPLLMVTHSLMVVLLPISTVDSSPWNFRSWGMADITAPGNILQFFPIFAPGYMVTLEPIQVPSPISTPSWIEVNASIVTFFPMWVFSCISDSLLIMRLFLQYWQS